MKIRVLFYIAGFGIIAGLVSAYIYNQTVATLPPIANNYNPYEKGIYANGIIESYQANGTNLNIYPEVSGKVTHLYVNDGQDVKKGDPLLAIDDTIEQGIVAKDDAQAQAALSALNELKAQPRKENLAVAQAQLDLANANLVSVQTTTAKILKAYALYPGSESKDAVDNANNALKVAQQNLKMAQSQYNLVSAGAWSFDIQNQESTYKALVQTYQSDLALLTKYVVHAPIDGVIMQMNATEGDYVSPQGIFDSYTQGLAPVVQMSATTPYLQVRCFLNEILVPQLPSPDKIEATLFIRGENNKSIPLEFIRILPLTIPNIQLSNERAQRVDVRVLPIIFKFKKPADINLFPGQLVDVYIKAKE